MLHTHHRDESDGERNERLRPADLGLRIRHAAPSYATTDGYRRFRTDAAFNQIDARKCAACCLDQGGMPCQPKAQVTGDTLAKLCAGSKL